MVVVVHKGGDTVASSVGSLLRVVHASAKAWRLSLLLGGVDVFDAGDAGVTVLTVAAEAGGGFVSATVGMAGGAIFAACVLWLSIVVVAAVVGMAGSLLRCVQASAKA